MKYATLIFILALVACTSALESKDVEELFQCDQIPYISEFDTSWVISAPYYYMPFMSKGFLYRIAQDFHSPEEFAKLTLADLDRSCYHYAFYKTEVPFHAFGRFNVYYSYPDPIRTSIRYFTSANGTVDKPVQYKATAHMTLTDKESYFVSINTWAEGLKNFVVTSNVPVLAEKTLKEIKAHLIENGFNSAHFATQDYTNCATPPTYSTLVLNH